MRVVEIGDGCSFVVGRSRSVMLAVMCATSLSLRIPFLCHITINNLRCLWFRSSYEIALFAENVVRYMGLDFRANEALILGRGMFEDSTCQPMTSLISQCLPGNN